MFVLNAPHQIVPHTGRRAAIVTIVIGEHYAATWMRLAHPTWISYAKIYGLDLIVIACPLDSSERAASRSPAWQKLLILNQPWSKNYERIIWLDSDIVIAPHAPNIMDVAGPAEKVSLTVSGGRISASERLLFLERLYDVQFQPDMEQLVWTGEVQKSYSDHSVPEHDVMFNTGVLVVSPEHHNDLFLQCYESEHVGRLYEQPMLSHEIIQRDLAHLISSRFNWGLQEGLLLYLPEILRLKSRPQAMHEPVLKLAVYLVRRELANSYFLHFYGSMGLMARLSHDDVYGGTALELFMDKSAPAAPLDSGAAPDAS